jgi:NAD-dependent dihydropyrimidine dehydrogenase PreA subunit
MNYVKVSADQCKGCRVCVHTCPHHCLVIGSEFNALGYQNSVFIGEDRCTACGLCFYACPEPGALTILKGEQSEGESDNREDKV